MQRYATDSDSEDIEGRTLKADFQRSPDNSRFPHISPSPNKRVGRKKKKYQPPDLTPAEIEKQKRRQVLARKHEKQKREQRRLKRERIELQLEREREWEERARAKQRGFSKNRGLQSKYKVSGKPGQDSSGLEHKPGGYGIAGLTAL